MPSVKLEIFPLPDIREADGRVWFKIRLNKDLRWQPEVWRPPVRDEQIATVLRDEALVSFDDKVRNLADTAARDQSTCRRALREGKWSPHDNKYVSIAVADFEKQLTEPTQCSYPIFWLYRKRLVKVLADGPVDELSLRVKHKVLSHEKALDKLRRDVEAFENFERLGGVSREPIPRRVRLFVWQRDRGRCVECGSTERLEYDHIISLAKGGSDTERNLQLLCERCNRQKGATI